MFDSYLSLNSTDRILQIILYTMLLFIFLVAYIGDVLKSTIKEKSDEVNKKLLQISTHLESLIELQDKEYLYYLKEFRRYDSSTDDSTYDNT